ncbi:LysR family transcriptional regulator (plasmid) [Sphingobium sp. SJ10-10]|uniref:LysR family transcriptional regulator n=1 Tax=Sphingobium sp. SJ10-10 TaxID=3114999 RepID=UPI002E183901|nr:LysR family transcriptional regulator [Sphingobium sp. SJ10-10]
MDARVLTVFVAAYEEGNFSRAAERLNATQPGISVQISTLETELGVSLFERTARGVVPTAAGKRLYPRALQIIHDLRKTELDMKSLSGVITGKITVGIPPTLSMAILASVLSTYVDAYPDVEIRIFEAYSDTLISLIESAQIDFALVAPLPNHPAIVYEKVFTDRFILASNNDLGLSERIPVSLNEPPLFKYVVPSVLRRSLSALLEEPLREGRIVPARMIEIDGLAGALEFIASSDWVGLLPSATAYSRFGANKIRFSPISEDIYINYFVAHLRTKPLDAACSKFVELITSELSLVEHGSSRFRISAPGKPDA